jgi:hypothetical protein
MKGRLLMPTSLDDDVRVFREEHGVSEYLVTFPAERIGINRDYAQDAVPVVNEAYAGALFGGRVGR